MTFFYDLNKKLAGLVQLNEGKNAKPDFLDVDKDGNKEEPMTKALKDKELDEASYSAKAARAGKDIGKPGKAFGKIAKDAAERYGSKERGEKVAGAVLAKLRSKTNEADMEEGNEFSGALAQAKASGASEFEVDGKKYKVTNEGFKEMDAWLAQQKKEKGTGKFDKKKISTGTVYTRRHEEDDEDEEASDTPKKKGRKTVGAGKGKKIGAKHKGTSKLHRKDAIAECNPEEYGMEGDKAKKDLKSVAMAAKELHSILGDNQDLPEWVQDKITRALDYINSSNQYMHQEMGDEMVAEKAVSQQQQKFMGMAHAMQKGEKIKGASPELKKVAKTMKKSDVTDFAKTKRSDLPKKVKDGEAVKEEGKTTGGMVFGKGVYEGMNDEIEQLITESMNVSVNMTADESGEPKKSITITADGESAEMLAQLLNLAGMQGQQQVDEVDENNPDWPTEPETTGENDPHLELWAGGLNKPKSTGQTTRDPFNRQRARQGAGEMAENVDLGMNLYAELKQFKAK